MRQFSPEYFLQLAAGFHGIASRNRSDMDLEIESEDLLRSGKLMAKGAALLCSEIGLRASAASAEKLARLYSSPKCSVRQEVALFDEWHGRLVDEMEHQFFMSLNTAEATRYQEWQRGWELIIDRFPDVTRDVEEMNKCFALNRFSASMFHALHVAEWGAIALGEHIKVTDPKKGWGPTERRLRELVNNGHAKLPEFLCDGFNFLEQMNREISSIVLAWRHKVDHAANHLFILPKEEFTPDVAEHIIGAVRIFMLRIVEGIPPIKAA